jgi:hypothetical protein
VASTQDQIIERVLAFIASTSTNDSDFNELALELFAFQFELNAPYRRFCQQRGVSARRLKRWQEIPAVPISAFKSLQLSCCDPSEAGRVFRTSGTTQAGVRGESFHADLRVYDASMERNFQARVMNGATRLRMGVLFPTETAMPNSSLAHYLALAIDQFGAPGSTYLIDDSGVDLERVSAALEKACTDDTPFALLGASYSFVHVMDQMAERGTRFSLPAGSVLMDTGGFKSQSRELALDEFYQQLSVMFGVPRERCINMYGMTELSTQFYDNGNTVCPSTKSGPHWIRTRAINPLTGEDVPSGAQGVLAHCDLAHVNIVTMILTEDAGVVVDDGFLLLGRADGAQAKGCSMAVEEFLRAARP